jgi:hypothetical protein
MAVQQPVRRPQGAPGGGQFAPGGGSEPAPLKLWNDGEGTYEFPPYCYTAREAIEFWGRVEISDRTLNHFISGYAMLLNEHKAYLRSEWELKNPQPRRDVEGWKARRNAAIKEGMSSWPRLDAPMVRPVLRIMQMRLSSRTMPPDERQRLFDTLVSLPGYPRPATIEQVYASYRGHLLIPYMVDPEFYDLPEIPQRP